MAVQHNLPELMTVRQLSEYLQVHPTTIYKLMRLGRLPGFRVGSYWRFQSAAIRRWCELRERAATLNSANREVIDGDPVRLR